MNPAFSLLLLLGLCLLTASQTINPCASGTDPFQPFVYNLIKLNETICPLSGTTQGALLCIPVSAGLAYSITGGVESPNTCIAKNTSLCGEGEFDVIVLFLGMFSMSGSLEISAQITVHYDNGSRPLQIESNQTLSVPGNAIIVPMVFGPLDPHSVCEILDNGTVVDGQFSTMLVNNDDCLSAVEGSTNSDTFAAAQSLLLSSQESLPAQQRTATLFLIPSTESCSPTATKLSNIFTINIEINATTPGPQTPEPPITPSQSTAVIIGISVSGFVALLLIIVALVVIVFGVRRRTTDREPIIDRSDGLELTLSTGSSNGSAKAFDEDNDSGFYGRSPGPSTPVKCIVIIVWKVADPWYTELKSTLGTTFSSLIKELILPKDIDKFDKFELDVHDQLEKPHVKHLLLIQNIDEAEQPHYPSFLRKVMANFESRPCDVFSKVWDIQLGVPEDFEMPKDKDNSVVHRLRISRSKGGSSGEQCAKEIYRRISYHDLQHPSDDEPLKASSHNPNTWPSIEQEKNTSSVPLQRKELEVQVISEMRDEMREMKSNMHRMANTTDRVHKITGKMAETIDRVEDATGRTRNLLEDTVAQDERNNIEGLEEETIEPDDS